MPELVYYDKASNLKVLLSKKVLDHFYANIQKRFGRENGGQLFGVFPEPDIVRLVKATGPSPLYRRLRNMIALDFSSDQKEINQEFARGLHYLGDWHSHPEPIPSPSAIDIRTSLSRFQESRHELNKMVMIIIGTENFPRGIWVGLQDSKSLIQLDVFL